MYIMRIDSMVEVFRVFLSPNISSLPLQDSPFPDTDSDSSDSSDSDSTFTDLTAAGRAAMGSKAVSSHSFPRLAGQEAHNAQSSFDLHLFSGPAAQVVGGATGGMFQNVTGFSHELRQLPASAEELRQLSSARQFITSSGELRQLTSSSAELRQLTASSGELRQLTSASGEFRQLTSSSGELRQLASTLNSYPPLLFPGELQKMVSTGDLRPLLSAENITHLTLSGGEFRLVPVSGGSWHLISKSPSGLQPTPSASTKYPALPDTTAHPLATPSQVEAIPATWGSVQLQTCNVQLQQPRSMPGSDVGPLPAVDSAMALSTTGAAPAGLAVQIANPQRQLHRPDHIRTSQPNPSHAQTQSPGNEVTRLPESAFKQDPQARLGNLQPSQSVLELEPPPLFSENLQAQSSEACAEAHSPPTFMQIQPPPSFREPHLAYFEEHVPLLNSSEEHQYPQRSFDPTQLQLHTSETVHLDPSSGTAQVVSANSGSLQQSPGVQAAQRPIAGEFRKFFSSMSQSSKSTPVPESIQSHSPSPAAKTPPSPPTEESQPLLLSPETKTPHGFPSTYQQPPLISSANQSAVARLAVESSTMPRPPTPSPARSAFRQDRDSVAVPRPLSQSKTIMRQASNSSTGKKGPSSAPDGSEQKSKGKQVTFKYEPQEDPSVIARKPSKTEATKKEKRCAQLFSYVDLSSPSSIDSLFLDSKSSPPSSVSSQSSNLPNTSRTDQLYSDSSSRCPPSVQDKKKGFSHREASTPLKPPRGSNLSSPVSPEAPKETQ